MNRAARRIDELRANEWRELFTRGRATGKSLQVSSIAQVRRHPLVAVGIAAALGLAAFAFLRSRSASKQHTKSEQTASKNGAREPEQKFSGLLSDTLRRAVGAWIIHSLTQPPPQKQS